MVVVLKESTEVQLQSSIIVVGDNDENDLEDDVPSNQPDPPTSLPAVFAAPVLPLSSTTTAINTVATTTTTASSVATAVTPITLDDLRRYFHLPIADVAKQLSTCTTALKKICRKLNISKWPYRQILSLTKTIQSLEMASLNDHLVDELKQQYRDQIQLLHKAIAEVMKNPNKPIDELQALSLLAMTPAGVVSQAMDLDLDDDNDNDLTDKLDVQHIIKSATAIIAQPTVAGAPASAANKKLKNKRKVDSDGTDEPGAVISTSSSVPVSVPETMSVPANSVSTPVPTSTTSASTAATTAATIAGSSAAGNSIAGDCRMHLPVPPLLHDTASSTLTALIATSFGARGEQDNGLAGPLLTIGYTTVQHDPQYENPKYQFFSPVQLAPLKRKKLSSTVASKVVPLMEPDIGSNYSIEFIPQFILGNRNMDSAGYQHKVMEQYNRNNSNN
jgi:hypothetical protein